MGQRVPPAQVHAVIAPGSDEERSALAVPWRTGQSIGRTIYATARPDPSDDDRVIGMLDTPELAAEAVAAHNAALVLRNL